MERISLCILICRFQLQTTRRDMNLELGQSHIKLSFLLNYQKIIKTKHEMNVEELYLFRGLRAIERDDKLLEYLCRERRRKT